MCVATAIANEGRWLNFDGSVGFGGRFLKASWAKAAKRLWNVKRHKDGPRWALLHGSMVVRREAYVGRGGRAAEVGLASIGRPAHTPEGRGGDPGGPPLPQERVGTGAGGPSTITLVLFAAFG
jgi:hypothetical protein